MLNDEHSIWATTQLSAERYRVAVHDTPDANVYEEIESIITEEVTPIKRISEATISQKMWSGIFSRWFTIVIGGALLLGGFYPLKNMLNEPADEPGEAPKRITSDLVAKTDAEPVKLDERTSDNSAQIAHAHLREKKAENMKRGDDIQNHKKVYNNADDQNKQVITHMDKRDSHVQTSAGHVKAQPNIRSVKPEHLENRPREETTMLFDETGLFEKGTRLFVQKKYESAAQIFSSYLSTYPAGRLRLEAYVYLFDIALHRHYSKDIIHYGKKLLALKHATHDINHIVHEVYKASLRVDGCQIIKEQLKNSVEKKYLENFKCE